MTFERKSRLIRWAYLFESDYRIPSMTKLCPLFWRVVLVSPLKVVIPSAIVGAILYGLFRLAVTHPGILVSALAIVVVSIVTVVWLDNNKPAAQAFFSKVGDTFSGIIHKPIDAVVESDFFSVIVQGFKAIHKQVCPLVTITPSALEVLAAEIEAENEKAWSEFDEDDYDYYDYPIEP